MFEHRLMALMTSKFQFLTEYCFFLDFIIQESVEQIGEISNRRVEDKSEKGSQLQKEELSRRAGELLATRILLTGWQRIVETLTNTITLNGVPMKSNVSFSPLKSFAGCRPSTCSTFYMYGLTQFHFLIDYR